MNKLNSVPLVLMMLTAFFATHVFAQPPGRGRGHQGNQRNQETRIIQQGNQNPRGVQTAKSGVGNRKTTGSALSDRERQDLVFMREEEKLARDIYLAMQAKWGERLFGNISQAESRHMSAIANLLSRYGIPDPVVDNTPGKFTAVQFQELYQSLLATGSKSLADALKVGLEIEEMDISDLRLAIQATNNQDVKRVLENLERGSRNHLRAFASRLKSAGGTYVATNLSQKEFDRIASSQQERGGANGRGGGRGQRQRGRGKNNGRR